MPASAHAGVFVGGQIDGAAGFGMPPGTHVGIGALGALGYRIGLGPVFLLPEARGGFTTLPGATVPVHIARVLGGFHVGLDVGKIQPGVFGHAGAGWLTATQNGPSFDVGAALSFRLVPLFLFGAQAAYNVVIIEAQAATTKWLSFGAHVGVEF